jgi:hypothetical protein
MLSFSSYSSHFRFFVPQPTWTDLLLAATPMAQLCGPDDAGPHANFLQSIASAMHTFVFAMCGRRHTRHTDDLHAVLKQMKDGGLGIRPPLHGTGAFSPTNALEAPGAS